MSDRSLLYLSAVVRAVATGFLGVLLGVYLARIGLDAGAIGLVASAGRAGAAFGACIVTLRGDRMGTRRALLGLTLASAAGGLALALASHPLALAAAASSCFVQWIWPLQVLSELADYIFPCPSPLTFHRISRIYS